ADHMRPQTGVDRKRPVGAHAMRGSDIPVEVRHGKSLCSLFTAGEGRAGYRCRAADSVRRAESSGQMPSAPERDADFLNQSAMADISGCDYPPRFTQLVRGPIE